MKMTTGIGNRGRSGNRPRGNRYRDRTGDPREQGDGKHGETARSDEGGIRASMIIAMAIMETIGVLTFVIAIVLAGKI